eukprot:Trichotokara_eunicae@DN4665_c0_g1_i1.p1
MLGEVRQRLDKKTGKRQRNFDLENTASTVAAVAVELCERIQLAVDDKVAYFLARKLVRMCQIVSAHIEVHLGPFFFWVGYLLRAWKTLYERDSLWLLECRKMLLQAASIFFRKLNNEEIRMMYAGLYPKQRVLFEELFDLYKVRHTQSARDLDVAIGG